MDGTANIDWNQIGETTTTEYEVYIEEIKNDIMRAYGIIVMPTDSNQKLVRQSVSE